MPANLSRRRTEAHRAGFLLLDACKDVADEYEVRRDHEPVARGRRKRAMFSLEAVADMLPANAIEVVNRLQHGFTAAARSRRLLRVTEKLRQRGLLDGPLW